MPCTRFTGECSWDRRLQKEGRKQGWNKGKAGMWYSRNKGLSQPWGDPTKTRLMGTRKDRKLCFQNTVPGFLGSNSHRPLPKESDVFFYREGGHEPSPPGSLALPPLQCSFSTAHPSVAKYDKKLLIASSTSIPCLP